MDYGGGDHQQGKLGLHKGVWLQVRECGLGLRPRLYASPVCDDSTAETAYVATVALHICFPLFTRDKIYCKQLNAQHLNTNYNHHYANRSRL